MERWGSVQLDVPDFSNSVLSHLNQLRAQGRLCDIVVHVQGQSFRAHKAVLAASSPYFRDHMSLSQMSTVSLTVIRNASVFEQLLAFCYTGRLRLQLRDIISYLTAASFLQMQEVIDRCTRILEGIHLKMGPADPDRPLADREAAAAAVLLPAPRGPEAPLGEEGEPRGPPTRRRGDALLRLDRAGRWYVESGVEADGAGDGIGVKTERAERRIGADEGEATSADASGSGTPGSGGGARPSSGLGEADR